MFKDFIEGITSYIDALGLLNKLKLWKFLIIPGVISIAIGGGVLLIIIAMASGFGSMIVALWPFDFGHDQLVTVSNFIGGITMGILGLIIFKYLVLIVNAPFMSPLSERIERHINGNLNHFPPFSINEAIKDVFRGIYLALRNIIRELSFTVFLLVLGLIPLFSPVSAVLIVLVEAYYAGFGSFDYALERRFKPKDRILWVKRNKALAAGNGIPFILLLAIPILGFFIAPILSVAAGTIVVSKRIRPAENDAESFIGVDLV